MIETEKLSIYDMATLSTDPKLWDQLRENFLNTMQKSPPSNPANPPENMEAENLELLARRLKEGKIQPGFVTGHLNETGDFIVTLRFRTK